MKRNFVFSMTAACLLVGFVNPSASQTPANSARTAHPELVVSTQWLADHLNDPNLVIVHIGHDQSDYHAAHIPGARYLAMNKFATGQTPPGTELLPVRGSEEEPGRDRNRGQLPSGLLRARLGSDGNPSFLHHGLPGSRRSGGVAGWRPGPVDAGEEAHISAR